MGGSRQEYIQYCRDDSPEDLAFAFCKEHGLNIKVYDFIVESLRQKYLQLQSGQLTESKTKAVGPADRFSHKSNSKLGLSSKQIQTEPAVKEQKNDQHWKSSGASSKRLHDRPTADSNHNLLASSVSRGFLDKESPRPELRTTQEADPEDERSRSRTESGM